MDELTQNGRLNKELSQSRLIAPTCNLSKLPEKRKIATYSLWGYKEHTKSSLKLFELYAPTEERVVKRYTGDMEQINKAFESDPQHRIFLELLLMSDQVDLDLTDWGPKNPQTDYNGVYGLRISFGPCKRVGDIWLIAESYKENPYQKRTCKAYDTNRGSKIIDAIQGDSDDVNGRLVQHGLSCLEKLIDIYSIDPKLVKQSKTDWKKTLERLPEDYVSARRELLNFFTEGI